MSDDARHRMPGRAHGFTPKSGDEAPLPGPAAPPVASGEGTGTRAQMCERRLRDAYPQILRDAGLDEATVDDLMAAYDSPFVDTQSPVSAASRYAPERPPRKPAG